MEEFMQAATKSVTSLSDDKPLSYGFFVFWSVAVWAVATLILRIWGQMFFIPESNLSMGASFLFSALFLPPLVYVLFRWQKVQPDQRGEALIYLTIPSMLLDVVTTYFADFSRLCLWCMAALGIRDHFDYWGVSAFSEIHLV
jgi:hypothetical protein